MLQKLIDDALKREQDSKKDRIRSGMISPSSLGRCYRYQYWNRLNEPISDPLDARTLRKFRAGKLFHDFVEGLLPDHDTEVLVKVDDILGYADIVTEDCVTDIKSAHTFDFKRFWSKGYDVYKEKESYWLQVATYAYLLKKPKCALFFVGKDDLCCEEFFAFTEKFVPKIEEELFILRTDWNMKNLPKAEPRAYGGRECQYCGFKTKCQNLNGVPAVSL